MSKARTQRTLASIVTPALLAVACGVPQQKYDASVRDASSARANAAACRASEGRLRTELTETRGVVAARDESLVKGARDAQYLQVRLDGTQAEVVELRKELQKLGKNADDLFAERGALSGALAETKARLEDLRKAQVASEARAALFRELALKFQRMVDAGALAVTLREGRMVLRLPNDVLFDSGQTVIKPEGRTALSEVAAVLSALGDRHYQVAGDTDDVPIQTARFPSNWELSTARAVEVVRFLIARGMRPTALSATGYGEFDPIAPNDTPEGKKKNRRIEIVVQPNIDEFVAVPTSR